MSLKRRCGVVILALGLALPALAQPPVFEVERDVPFDDPEAWAMKYFASASLFTSLGPVPVRRPGEVELGLEVIQIPHLSAEERTVGFGGFKEEDLNRSPVWGRVRLAVGLPGRFNVVLGWAPPIEVDGAEANLVSLALEKVLLDRRPWGLGLRLYAQAGEAEGDFTCGDGVDTSSPPGSPGNPFGCEAPSDDTVNLEYTGVELNASYQLGAAGGPGRAPTLHLGVAFNAFDTDFQVDALTFGFRDRTHLFTDGDTVSLNAGATWALGERTHLGLELFYSALDVERPGQERENDPLFNARAIVRYRVR